jgi:hypothetical protein
MNSPSLVADHSGTTIAIVEVVAESDHAVGTRIVGADTTKRVAVTAGEDGNGLDRLCASRATHDLDGR